MIRTICLASFLVLSLVTVGCSDSSRRPVPTSTSPGVVGQLTGDPDDQISVGLQAQVAEALTRGDTDEPVDTF